MPVQKTIQKCDHSKIQVDNNEKLWTNLPRHNVKSIDIWNNILGVFTTLLSPIFNTSISYKVFCFNKYVSNYLLWFWWYSLQWCSLLYDCLIQATNPLPLCSGYPSAEAWNAYVSTCLFFKDIIYFLSVGLCASYVIVTVYVWQFLVGRLLFWKMWLDTLVLKLNKPSGRVTSHIHW